MKITDEDIYSYIKSKKTIREKDTPSEIVEYMTNRFSTVVSFKEALYRFRNNIFEDPVCIVCGNKVSFSRYGFATCCSNKCVAKISVEKRKNNPNYKFPFENKEIRDKAKQSIVETYNVDNVFKLKEIRNKGKQTKLERYGNENYNNTEKFKQTCLERYGCNAPSQNIEIRKRQIKTATERYGSVFNKQQVSKTIKLRYGVDWFTQSDAFKSKTNTKDSLEKQYNTKRKNNSFNSSKIEVECLKLLKDKFNDIIYQYYDDKRYPFNCDFYIPSLDIFIELNCSWTHGGHPYNSNSKDKETLLKWQEKSKTSKFYENAIYTWTVRDVKKRQVAKDNKLNYYEFWNLNDVIDFLKNF